MPARSSSAKWEGKLKDGKGTMKVGSGVYEGPFSFVSRFESGDGTNPEEDDAVLLFDRLRSRSMTRLTTRLNPEEMNFDPVFEPGEVRAAQPLVFADAFDHLCLEPFGPQFGVLGLDAVNQVEAEVHVRSSARESE